MRRFALLLFYSATLLGQPSSADQALAEGVALAKEQRYADAERRLLAARREFPGDVRFLLELAGVSYRLKQFGTAKDCLRTALRHDRDNAYGNEFLAALYQLDGNLEAALVRWNRVGKPLLQGVRFEPDPAIPPLLLERSVAFSGGQILTVERLRATEARLNLLGIFSQQRLELAPAEAGRWEATYRLTPAGRLLEARWATLIALARGLPFQSIRWDQANIARSAWNAGAMYRWDSRKRRAGVEFGGPIGPSPTRRFEGAVDARHEEWDFRVMPDLVRLRKARATAGVTFLLRDRVQWSVGMEGSRRTIAGGPGGAGLASGWTLAQVNRFSMPLLRMPDYRLRVQGEATLRTGRFFTTHGSRRLVSGYTGASLQWHPQARRDDWEVRAAGYAGTVSGAPFDEYFLLGMERDNPLWIRGIAGSRDGRKGSGPIARNFGLVQSGVDRTVFRLPLLQVKAGPFFDAGRTGGFLASRWDAGAGLQVRLLAGGMGAWSLVAGRDLRRGDFTFYSTVAKFF